MLTFLLTLNICQIFQPKTYIIFKTVTKSRMPVIELPLELECEIFKCLPPSKQLKFVTGLGSDIASIFVPKLSELVKVKFLMINYLKSKSQHLLGEENWKSTRKSI
jgi:hypothetical protein